MEEYKSPNGAVITKQWYETTRKLLSDPADRAAVYEGILDLTFTGSFSVSTNPIVTTILEMVRPFVSQDVEKYHARCERNKQNASRSQSLPVAASGSQSLPVATNNNNNNNNNSNSNNNNNSNSNNNKSIVSTSTDEQEAEKEKFYCLLTILKRGSLSPVLEFGRFWNYYESLGWKNKNGAPIVRKVSAAAMWTLQTDIAADTIACSRWATALSTLDKYDEFPVKVFRGCRVEGDTLKLLLELSPESIRQFDAQYIKQVASLAKLYSVKNVDYCIAKTPK